MLKFEKLIKWVVGSAVERVPDKNEVDGSTPSRPTVDSPGTIPYNSLHMTFCEIPEEGPVEKEDHLLYCPFEAAKKDGTGWADRSFVKCHHLEECRARRAVAQNHATSDVNTNFIAHLPTTPLTEAQRIPGATTAATKWKK